MPQATKWREIPTDSVSCRTPPPKTRPSHGVATETNSNEIPPQHTPGPDRIGAGKHQIRNPKSQTNSNDQARNSRCEDHKSAGALSGSDFCLTVFVHWFVSWILGFVWCLAFGFCPSRPSRDKPSPLVWRRASSLSNRDGTSFRIRGTGNFHVVASRGEPRLCRGKHELKIQLAPFYGVRLNTG